VVSKVKSFSGSAGNESRNQANSKKNGKTASNEVKIFCEGIVDPEKSEVFNGLYR
jgi:hypothetical protein